MPHYTCANCHKEFNQLGHYQKHITRTVHPCKADGGSSTPIFNQTVKPLLKYVGGKTQILKEVLSRFPSVLSGRYYEPFVGGGSVLLAFLENRDFKGRVVATDLNRQLIAFYKTIQTNVDGFLAEIKILVDAYTVIQTMNGVDSKEEFYYCQRTLYNTLIEEEVNGTLGAALFLFLNKTGFRGLHRVGPHGFNVPFGNYKNPSIYEEEHVRAVAALIAHVEFRCCDFRKVLQEAVAGDFVYMDPPYVPLVIEEEDGKNFVGYTVDGFGAADHEELFRICEKLTESGIHWLMSNSDVAELRGRFVDPPYKVSVVSCRRAINAKAPGSRANELLILSEVGSV